MREFACWWKKTLEMVFFTLCWAAGITAGILLILGDYIACHADFWKENFDVYSPLMMTIGTLTLIIEGGAVIVGLIASYDWASRNCRCRKKH